MKSLYEVLVKQNIKHNYIHFPKNINELKKIIEDKIDTEGLNCDLNDIDTSKIESMQNLFSYEQWSSDFNGNISGWDVSNVKDMEGIFTGCKKFDGDLSKWDVSNVIYFNGMFKRTKFNNNSISNWKFKEGTNFNGMFQDSLFNQDLSKWRFNKDRPLDFNSMFYGSKFNKPIKDWNIENAIDMSRMFACSEFNQNISNWKISEICGVRHMFDDCSIDEKNKPVF